MEKGENILRKRKKDTILKRCDSVGEIYMETHF